MVLAVDSAPLLVLAATAFSFPPAYSTARVSCLLSGEKDAQFHMAVCRLIYTHVAEFFHDILPLVTHCGY